MNDVGKKLLALDIDCPVSPAIRCVFPNTVSLREIVARLQARIDAVIAEVLPGGEWSMEPLRVRIHPQTRHVLPAEEEERIREAKLEPLREMFAIAHDIRQEKAINNPHNGTLGWWLVSGVRHSAAVKADSALSAAEKSGIDSWESPTATWIGGEDVDVIEL